MDGNGFGLWFVNFGGESGVGGREYILAKK
jgi:hypothetical protein